MVEDKSEKLPLTKQQREALEERIDQTTAGHNFLQRVKSIGKESKPMRLVSDMPPDDADDET